MMIPNFLPAVVGRIVLQGCDPTTVLLSARLKSQEMEMDEPNYPTSIHARSIDEWRELDEEPISLVRDLWELATQADGQDEAVIEVYDGTKFSPTDTEHGTVDGYYDTSDDSDPLDARLGFIEIVWLRPQTAWREVRESSLRIDQYMNVFLEQLVPVCLEL